MTEINIGVKNKKLLKIRDIMNKYLDYYEECRRRLPDRIVVSSNQYRDLSRAFSDDMTFRGVKICR